MSNIFNREQGTPEKAVKDLTEHVEKHVHVWVGTILLEQISTARILGKQIQQRFRHIWFYSIFPPAHRR